MPSPFFVCLARTGLLNGEEVIISQFFPNPRLGSISRTARCWPNEQGAEGLKGTDPSASRLR